LVASAVLLAIDEWVVFVSSILEVVDEFLFPLVVPVA